MEISFFPPIAPAHSEQAEFNCRLYGRWFLQVERPNQQYQSTEGMNYRFAGSNSSATAVVSTTHNE